MQPQCHTSGLVQNALLLSSRAYGGGRRLFFELILAGQMTVMLQDLSSFLSA